jgi:PAS domain S-box-containing protein
LLAAEAPDDVGAAAIVGAARAGAGPAPEGLAIVTNPPLPPVARWLAAIVESSDDAIVSKDLDGIVTSWNHAAERLFGFTAAEMIGTSIRRVIPPDRQSEEDEVLAKIRRGEKVDHFETIRQRKDGSLVPISLTVSPIRDEEGTVVGASKIARDITERKLVEQSRAELLRVAQEASRLKDEFLATLSHELRTPLNAIFGYARMMRAGAIADDRQQHAMETIERNATALARIVEDILDVSAIIAGKLRLKIQPVELSSVVTEALATVRPAAEARGVAIEAELGTGMPRLAGDPDRLQQIVWNLLSNGVKFTERGGTVRISLEQVNSNIELTVSDTGIGIMPEFLPYVFDRFRQADAGASRERGGLGLGLAIARHLVELHGGTISVASQGQNHGTSFRVLLPLNAPLS